MTFPADLGPHDDFRTEWWYYTGNLIDAAGRHFGYQLTFFRRALLPPGQRMHRESDWATEQVYMAHLALTDVEGRQHQAYERLARGAAGLAGVQAAPYHVWLDNWSVASQDGTTHLQAAQGDIALDFELQDLKQPVLQGDQGYSRKGPEPGNASYYYSLTRIATTGTIAVGGQKNEVPGLSWMDHEFSTTVLSPGQVGWDWFSLQLEDGRELMLFHTRRSDGSSDPYAPALWSSATAAPGCSVHRTSVSRPPASGAARTAAGPIRTAGRLPFPRRAWISRSRPISPTRR